MTDDDRHLADALRRRGVDVRSVVWGDERQDDMPAVLIRSTWDYTERPDEFCDWLYRLPLMELELVEPELFFRLAPEAAERFAGVLVDSR